MDTNHLLKRRAAVVARHDVLESVPGSGWHCDDARARAERHDGFASISSRPVAIQNDNEFYFVGECVPIVRAALANFIEEYDAARAGEAAGAEESGTEPPDMVPQLRHAYRMAKKFGSEAGDVIKLGSQEFNGLTYALNAMKTLVVVAGVLP